MIGTPTCSKIASVCTAAGNTRFLRVQDHHDVGFDAGASSDAASERRRAGGVSIGCQSTSDVRGRHPSTAAIKGEAQYFRRVSRDSAGGMTRAGSNMRFAARNSRRSSRNARLRHRRCPLS